jgi:hypothetical protein
MPSTDIRSGELTLSDTQFSTARGDKRGQLVVVGGGGNYQEAAYRGRTFSGANQGPAGTTTTVGLAQTYTGLCLSNPSTSAVNLVLNQVGYTVTAAPTAAAIIGLLGGWATAGVVTHTTPLIAHNNLWNSTIGTNGTGLVDAAATLVGTTYLLKVLGQVAITGATAQAAVPPTIQSVFDINGEIVLTPGAYVALYTSTVVAVIASMSWSEIPV